MTAQESPKDDAPKCPVDHSTFKHFLPKDAMPEGHPPVPTMTSDGEPAKCPVSPEAHKHFMPRNTTTSQPSDTPSSSTSSPASSSSSSSSSSTLKIDPTNNMPASPDQFRIASQTRDLNTEREISTIPKAANAADPYGEKGSSSGNHAADPDGDSDSVWIYPSEQMFFNAMKRKNWNPREEDMKFVVPIHNMVNEMAWKHILKWEKNMENTCGGPKLVKFEGKPKEITPKARLRSWMGYTLPFDRHDWVVDRCGKQVTYIIDFYSGQPDPRYPEAPSFYLDVRPKLTPEGAWQRFKKFMFD
ncbi:Cytochrome c1 heme lyase [Haplosporangium bisporale]|uniref:Holocytochrome c-type synthase n=1 Tax=Podila verticillata NRRL 6337 TaxID=1069443 RepID=A0A086TLQ5_9FUNG|nr:Cytochrome c1 heme lyase [Haplosporangium bisporale]KAF9209980.1 Cytochrome c1 heme lyase [Podila verticillata]KFH62882.1 cytochrome c heme-lyase [Podila verticillata NRRL 6337]